MLTSLLQELFSVVMDVEVSHDCGADECCEILAQFIIDQYEQFLSRGFLH